MIKNQKEWVHSLREISLLPDSPIQQKDGKWEVASRKETWTIIAPKIFDDHLDRIRSVAVEILREKDPQFDLKPDERFAASIHGKVLKHSRSLRKGLAETLALLGSKPSLLTSCSHGKAETTATLAVREIFKDADWLLWASLNDCLPTLAEASPAEFLNGIEKSLESSPSPFLNVFAQESNSIGGQNYMTGLLWGLETLAWHPDYLTRTVVLLGELAAIDPGGNYANRPINSLTDIFLPWRPQTCADIDKRKAAVKALLREQPSVCWRLLVALLPNKTTIATGTHKPIWRDFIPSDWNEKVSTSKYWEEVAIYIEIAVQQAKQDTLKLLELIEHLNDLPNPYFSELLLHFESDQILGLSEDQKYPIWEALIKLVSQHRRFSDADWAMKPDVIERIETIAAKLAPQKIDAFSRHLFSARDWDLYEEKDNFDEQQKKLNQKRKNAISEILRINQLDGVIKFAQEVESPRAVGIALGQIEIQAIDEKLLPGYLNADLKALVDFVGGFVLGRLISKEWVWVDSILNQSWTSKQKADFLILLPFQEETWKRVNNSLKEDKPLYWKRANVQPYGKQENLLLAVEELLQQQRPRAALLCLGSLIHHKKDFAPKYAVEVLQQQLKSEESFNLEQYYTLDLIEWLQNHPPENKGVLFQIEWLYLPLLDVYGKVRPVNLERELSANPAFFCEVIRSVFRSAKEAKGDAEPTEEQKNLARNAYDLLHKWKLVPGVEGKGILNEVVFTAWLAEVKRLAQESGHLKMALYTVGQVLPYAPADPDGLWIHISIAKTLNVKDADSLRSGFTNKLFDMRGVHSFTAGKAEREIAARFHEKAEALDKRGYQRIAGAIRELAKSYEQDAEREARRDPDKD